MIRKTVSVAAMGVPRAPLQRLRFLDDLGRSLDADLKGLTCVQQRERRALMNEPLLQPSKLIRRHP